MRFGLRLGATLLALVFTQTSCAAYLSLTMPGPKSDENVHVGMRRVQVESTLQEGAVAQFQDGDETETRYEYSDGPSGWAKTRAILYVGADVFTLFLAELIFWPIELYAKDQIKRVAVARYDRETVLKQWTIQRRGGETLHAEVLPPEPVVVAATPPAATRPASETQAAAVLPTASPPLDPALPSDLDYGSYHALVIGNNRYEKLPALRTASADAAAVADVLRSAYGYRVERLEDATRAEIISALTRYRRSLTSNDNLLIYYAGHGWLDKATGRGYWMPVDASTDDAANWLSSATITDSLKANPAKHIMVIADTCYSGVLTRGIMVQETGRGYYTRLARMKARTALTSGGLEPVEDGTGRHSVFAGALLRTLRENEAIIDGHALFQSVRRPVMLGAEQTPEYGDIRLAGHEGGDFLFVRADRGR